MRLSRLLITHSYRFISQRTCSINHNNNHNNRFYSSTIEGNPDCVKYDVIDNQIAVIGFNRPEAKNAISLGLLRGMSDALTKLEEDVANSIRAVIVRSLVKGVFCAGADLKERAKMPPESVGPFVAWARKTVTRLENLSKPVIIALDGVAVGGGFEIALAGDIRVAASDAKLGLVETRLAIIPGGGGTQRLPRLVGPARAKYLIFTSKTLNGYEAFENKLVEFAVEQNSMGDAAFQKALMVAKEIIPNGPIAIKLAKEAINNGMQTDLTTALKIEESCYAQVIPTQDRLEGLAAFKEKRSPKYIGK